MRGLMSSKWECIQWYSKIWGTGTVNPKDEIKHRRNVWWWELDRTQLKRNEEIKRLWEWIWIWIWMWVIRRFNYVCIAINASNHTTGERKEIKPYQVSSSTSSSCATTSWTCASSSWVFAVFARRWCTLSCWLCARYMTFQRRRRVRR